MGFLIKNVREVDFNHIISLLHEYPFDWKTPQGTNKNKGSILIF